MTRYGILLFLLSVYAMLAGVCFLMPEGGITVGPCTLGFPSPAEMRSSLVPDKSPQPAPDPEQLIRERVASIRNAEQRRFDEYFESNPARLHFPDGDISMFDPFFRSLDNARARRMRILHYGDSQIEEDRITSTVRARLQERFGGGGPGLLPFGRPYYTLCFSESSTAELCRYLAFGEGNRRSDSKYGIMGQCVRLDTSVFTSVSATKGNKGPSRYFRRMTMLSGGGVKLKCNGRQYAAESPSGPSGVARITVDLPDSSYNVRFSTWGYGDIYGFQLDDTLGVCMDNIPMRGCSGTIFTRISSAQLKEYAENDNVRLVILQFGGNAMPYRKTGKSISEFKQSLEKQIRHLHALMPDACILFIGPSDMSTSIGGRMKTYPHLPMMVDSLRAAAFDAGAAYWDMYAAMGGEGSMAEWVKAKPALAGSDHVHFTPLGAEAVGNMLYESLMVYYEYYRMRKGAPAE